MKKENRNIYVNLLIIVLLISMFVLSVEMVSAETILQKFVSDISFGNINLTFLDEGLKFGENIWFVRVLFFLLVALIIYAVSDFIPIFEEHKYAGGIVSVIIAILATFYLSNQEVYTILLSYNALGIALTSIIPFMVILAISKKFHDKGHTSFSKVIWIFFIGFLFYRWAFADSTELGIFGMYAYPVIIGLSFILFLWENRLWFLLFKTELRGYADTARENAVARITADLDRLVKRIEDTDNNTVKERLISQHDKMAEKARELGV